MSFRMSIVAGIVLALNFWPASVSAQSRNTTEEWVHWPVRILFAQGSSRLDDQARAMLREMHASVNHRTDITRIRVEGHSDIASRETSDPQLGLERARAVIDYVVNTLGMRRDLFEAKSFGNSRPINPNGGVPNSRVEFNFLIRRVAAP